jgi:hypothetical protein
MPKAAQHRAEYEHRPEQWKTARILRETVARPFDVICQSQLIDWFISQLSLHPLISREQSELFEIRMRGDHAAREQPSHGNEKTNSASGAARKSWLRKSRIVRRPSQLFDVFPVRESADVCAALTA